MNTSYKKSHSVTSNFKLTFIMIITSLLFGFLFVILAYKNDIKNNLFYALLSIDGIALIFNLFLISRFKR